MKDIVSKKERGAEVAQSVETLVPDDLRFEARLGKTAMYAKGTCCMQNPS